MYFVFIIIMTFFRNEMWKLAEGYVFLECKHF